MGEDKGACRDLAHWLLNFAPLGCHMPCYNKEHYNEPGNSDLHDIIWKCLKSHAKSEGREKSKLEMFYVYYATYVLMIFRYFVVMFWPGFYSIGYGMEHYGVSGCVKVPVLERDVCVSGIYTGGNNMITSLLKMVPQSYINFASHAWILAPILMFLLW